MSSTTNIEWCDSTFNPWIGCTPVSTEATGGGGCDGCYAAVSTPARTMGIIWGSGQPRHRTSPENWRQPKRWNNAHTEFLALHGRRRRVFCASLADVFDNEVDLLWRIDLFALIQATTNLDWLLLTKRIGNVTSMLREARDEAASERGQSRWPGLAQWLGAWLDGKPPVNVWLGATIVNQREADRDIPKLLAVPAVLRFLSMEPLLEAVLFKFPRVECLNGCGMVHPMLCNNGKDLGCPTCGCYTTACSPVRPNALRGIDWVIAGGESGPKARPMHSDWVRILRGQCSAAGVPFFFKQWGEWARGCGPDGEGQIRHAFPGGAIVAKVGKKAAGRLLDGVVHNEFPRSPGLTSSQSRDEVVNA